MCSSLSCVQLFVTAWTIAHQAPLSMRFSRQEYWSGLPFPSLFIEDFSIYVHRDSGLYFSFLMKPISGFGIKVMRTS